MNNKQSVFTNPQVFVPMLRDDESSDVAGDYVSGPVCIWRINFFWPLLLRINRYETMFLLFHNNQ